MGTRKKRRRPIARPPATLPGVTIEIRGEQSEPVLRAVRLLLEDAGARVAAVGVGGVPQLPAEHTKLVAELDETAIAELHEWMES